MVVFLTFHGTVLSPRSLLTRRLPEVQNVFQRKLRSGYMIPMSALVRQTDNSKVGLSWIKDSGKLEIIEKVQKMLAVKGRRHADDSEGS